MSVVPKITRDMVSVIAQTVGIDLGSELAEALSQDVEYRLREVIQEGTKFMHHSKRDVLSTTDINAALRLRNVESLYGYSAPHALSYDRAPEHGDLYFPHDPIVDFTSVINEPLPECPRDMTYSVHWLAVEGVQPAIPQNPTPLPVNGDAGGGTKRKRRGSASSGAASSTSAGVAVSSDGSATAVGGGGGGGGGGGDAAGASGSGGNGDVAVRPLVKHVLSKELQLYYEKVTDAILGMDEELRDMALRSLEEDPGLNELVPYLCQFVWEEVTAHLLSLHALVPLMRLVRALLNSPYLNLEPYLHQLMPPILTCLVAKRLCEDGAEDHWSLRDMSAELIATICHRYGPSYPTLQPRVTKSLVTALMDPTKPLTTHYGAVCGMTALGLPTIQLLLLPYVREYMALLQRVREAADASDAKKLEADRVYDALVRAAGCYLREARKSMMMVKPVAASSSSAPSSKAHQKSDVMDEGDAEDAQEDAAAAATTTTTTTSAANGADAEATATATAHPSYDQLVERLIPSVEQCYTELRDIFGPALDPFVDDTFRQQMKAHK